MTLTANLLNAVGGHPRLDSPRMLPGYPRCLPHGDCSFEVPLLRFSPEALDVFLKIEYPDLPGAPPESDAYEIIGQFYDAIRGGLSALCASLGEAPVFCGDPARQSPTRRSRGEAGSSRSTASPRRSRRSTRSWNKVRALRMSRCGTETTTTLSRSRSGRALLSLSGAQVWPALSPRRHAWVRSDRRHDLSRLEWRPTHADDPRTSDHAPGSAIRRAQDQFNDSYCAILRVARPSVQRQPAVAEHRDQFHVPTQGPGPGVDGDANRGWDHDRRSDLRIHRSRQVKQRGRGYDYSLTIGNGVSGCVRNLSRVSCTRRQ